MGRTLDDDGSEGERRVRRWSPVGALGRWTAGVLAAVIATVAAGLIQNAFSNSQDTDPAPGTQTASMTDIEPTAEASSTTELPATSARTGTNEVVKMLYTTYVWDESDGWVEHASWESSARRASFEPVLGAWNWFPNHPPVTVQFDNFKTLDSSDNFDDGMSGMWNVVSESGGSATAEGGRLVLSVPEGTSAEGEENRIDLYHEVSMGDEFDISVRFYLEDDFYSTLTGGVGLFAVGDASQAIIWIAEGEYRSEHFGDSDNRVIASTDAGELEGGLRIKGARLND